MIAVLRSWLTPAGRRPRRTGFAAQPLTEALETRALLAGSITADIGGVTLPVVSLTLPQPASSQTQDVSLILKLSADDQQLLRDAAMGQILHDVTITLTDGGSRKDTIQLTNALITSYQLIQNPAQDDPSIALTLRGTATGRPGSITASIDGVMPSVVSLTLPQPPTSGAQHVSLVVKLSSAVTRLLQTGEQGRPIPNVEITLDRIGNGSSETISLTGVLIASFSIGGEGDTDDGDILPEVDIMLVAKQETIELS